MPAKPVLTPKRHKHQIEAYAKVWKSYDTFAKVLKRVLEDACRSSFPEAFVQSRAKTVSSFAEKAARKFETYPNAVRQMTDLCGARVIVQTMDQVRAVRQFIEANFDIVEAEDKGLLLSTDEFGYRDMHYIVRLRANRAAVIGVVPEEAQAIGKKRAEIQVRTWLQHAWADTLHDRMYKNKLKLTKDVVRTGALLAALMEEGDRSYNYLADQLDGLIANYTAFATRDQVAKEIEVQRVILANEGVKGKRAVLALKLGRLLAAWGDPGQVVNLLTEYAGEPGAFRCELLLDLGFALCRSHRGRPASSEYRQGVKHLEAALHLCSRDEVTYVPHPRRRESLHARALVRLGWALEPFHGRAVEVRKLYQQAHEHEPANPYYLAAMLGFEMRCAPQAGLSAVMRATLIEAVKSCRQHAEAGIELPYAHFTAGRLSLLLEESNEALGYYSLGIRHCLAGTHCVPPGVFAWERHWIEGLHHGLDAPAGHQRAIHLLTLAGQVEGSVQNEGAADKLKQPVAILAGGATSISAGMLAKIRPMLMEAFRGFDGTAISGGTTVGVPGCIGGVAADLAAAHEKHFSLIGYLPESMPHGVFVHPGYDRTVKVGDNFLPEQVLRNWSDILAAGIDPKQVLLLGFGGGPLAGVEYRIALGLGASVGIVSGTGGTAETLLADSLWSALPNLYALPFDAATVRAFIIPPDHKLNPAAQLTMAQCFHSNYVAGSSRKLPPSMRPWDKLDETFQRANLEQAHYSVEILEAAGFQVRRAKGRPVIFTGFKKKDVERMAELEHGRWNVERLREGWRAGARDDAKKLHDCLAPWDKLSEEIKEYDRAAVRAFPEILAKAGLEVRRA